MTHALDVMLIEEGSICQTKVQVRLVQIVG